MTIDNPYLPMEQIRNSTCWNEKPPFGDHGYLFTGLHRVVTPPSIPIEKVVSFYNEFDRLSGRITTRIPFWYICENFDLPPGGNVVYPVYIWVEE